MIKEIKSIHGIGRYAKCDISTQIKKNQVIFGFNGTGKSTLSDIFYSMSGEGNDLLDDRQTLPLADGTAPCDMFVSFETDSGELTYEEGEWSKEGNTYVFNDHYIDEYLFVEDNHSIDNGTVIFGKAGTQLAQRKQELLKTFSENIEKMNIIIGARKELCSNLGFGKTKLKTTGWEKRIQQMATTKLYTAPQRTKIDDALQQLTAYDERIQIVQKWKESLECGLIYSDADFFSSVKQVKKLLFETPKITNKEISDHIAKYMSHADVNWLAMGTRYQADESLCPFCGQSISSSEYRKMTIQLSRFIKSKQKQKADDISRKIRRLQPLFDEVRLEGMFNAIQVIKNESQGTNLLHRPSIRLLESLQIGSSIGIEDFTSIAGKLATKIENPYESIVLSLEEILVCEAVTLIVKKLTKLISSFENEIQAIESKIQRTSEYTKSKSLYEASFGEAQESITELINLAQSTKELDKMIRKCQLDIDTLFETKKIDSINDFLRELNVNFRVKLENRKYCVQITGYEATEYSKDNKILCSEGERRILALAYFLQEISETSSPKVIIIDDPISSLDLSRKSVVAFKIAELMGTSTNQIIVLTHDISFVEKINSIVPENLDLGLLELCRDNDVPFKELHLDDYLITDEEVYSRIIRLGEESADINIKIIGLMALRPYAFIKSGMNPINPEYLEIEKRSTHLAHSIYSRSLRVPYRPVRYNKKSLRAYCKRVSKVTKMKIDYEKLVPDNWEFRGFNYEKAWEVYSAIPVENISNLRMKAMLFRLVLETSLYMLVNKKTLNPERIGLEYSKAIKGTNGEKRDMCIGLDRLYDLSKKYHHGVDGGSTLGLSALNPDEMLYYDEQICAIHSWIINHSAMCNPNAMI